MSYKIFNLNLNPYNNVFYLVFWYDKNVFKQKTIIHNLPRPIVRLFFISVFACPQFGYALEFDPPFLLIDEDSTEQSPTPAHLNNFSETPSSETISEQPISDVTSDNDSGEFISENIDVATPIKKPPFFSFLDNHQKLISNYLHLTILSVDNFFATNQAINESTGSHLRLTLETIWPEGQGADFNGSVSLRARLPGMREKYRLVVESDPVEQKELLELESRQREPNQTINDRGLYTGVEKKVGLSGWNINPSLGVKLRSPLDFYARLRLDRSIYFDQWALFLNESIYWFDSSGFGFDSTVRWDRPLSRAFLFRTTSLLRYSDETDIYNMSQIAEVIHNINPKKAITYKVGVFGHADAGVHTTNYLINLLYRHNIHSDYLFLDLQPQILFNKENNFEAQYEFLMRIEIYYRD